VTIVRSSVEEVEYFESFCRSCGGMVLWTWDANCGCELWNCGCEDYSYLITDTTAAHRIPDKTLVMWDED